MEEVPAHYAPALWYNYSMRNKLTSQLSSDLFLRSWLCHNLRIAAGGVSGSEIFGGGGGCLMSGHIAVKLAA